MPELQVSLSVFILQWFLSNSDWQGTQRQTVWVVTPAAVQIYCATHSRDGEREQGEGAVERLNTLLLLLCRSHRVDVVLVEMMRSFYAPGHAS